MNTFGLVIGLITLAVIGIGAFWVIRGERVLGYLWWPYFIGAGVLLMVTSGFIKNDWCSALAGVIGASLVWGATEFKEQAIRAELGWYPFGNHKKRPPFAKIIQKWKPPNL
ncbi:MAG: DUF4491 family protein [Anaerolineales bacterium]|nr:DUF4491 family protein [Anaerolineales bacterium]